MSSKTIPPLHSTLFEEIGQWTPVEYQMKLDTLKPWTVTSEDNGQYS